jgi:3-oxoadipate enol-lactonase
LTILGHRQIGAGDEAVLVMHEWLGDHSNYDPVLPYLDQRRYRWVFADLRGYGLSRELHGDCSCREAAGDVLALADHLRLPRFHLLGHSMSAMVAQRVAADARARVGTLIAVTPVPACGASPPPDTLAAMRALPRDDAVALDAIDARSGRRYHRAWLEAKLGLARRAAAPAVQDAYLAMFTGTDFSADVAGLDVPLRIIAGEHDLPMYREAALRAQFTRWFADLQIVSCRESGHYPMLECPVFFAAQVEKFLAAGPRLNP